MKPNQKWNMQLPTQPIQGTPGIFPGNLKLFISGFIHSSQNQDNPDVIWQVNS